MPQAETAGLAPAVSLPKGGGAIRGIGEKFAANPVTGTASTSIPIATSPGRSGFAPKLALSYDSGAGNSAFGFGWSLAIPAITRKTATGLPRYQDAAESDEFSLSEAEDLVPALRSDGTRDSDSSSMAGYRIDRYRPRIDSRAARIERWTRLADNEVHWRALTNDNILNIYGASAESRLADPLAPQRIFSWLLCETRDDRGNAILYRYKAEDGEGIDAAQPHEANRGGPSDVGRSANRYIKRILYGNRRPLLGTAGERPIFLTDLPASHLAPDQWLFELLFDYGEHDLDQPTSAEQQGWAMRPDAFSTYRAGFEIRTARLCRRILMLHHIPDIAGGDPGYDAVVKSTDLAFLHDAATPIVNAPAYAMLHEVAVTGWRRRSDGSYLRRSTPPLAFTYSLPELSDEVEVVAVAELPVGVDGQRFRWLDLHGEGTEGVFSEAGGEWRYARNLSPLDGKGLVLEPAQRLGSRPLASPAASAAEFGDLTGNGQLDVIERRPTGGGFYEHDLAEGWSAFRPFAQQLNRNSRAANSRFADLTGDGRADLLVSEEGALLWHESLGEAGFGPEQRVLWAEDEEQGPRINFADPAESIHLADLSGDGLADLVRIGNGEISYWPNLGYGRFGAKVTMTNAPRFDRAGAFDPRRLVLGDIDGSGTTDLIYLHSDGARLYFNQSGNSWSDARALAVAPPVDSESKIALADLLGNGTACLIWSAPGARQSRTPLRYVNLMGGSKPHLLIRTANNLGAETHIHYAPSTKFYLADRRAGRPWRSRLPFPVHVVERTETRDLVARSRFITRYAYHHGYYDGVEREFRGFAMVEQWEGDVMAARAGDIDYSNEDPRYAQPPTYTKSWFHTGMWLGRDAQSAYFAQSRTIPWRDSYYREPGQSDAQAEAALLADHLLPAGLSTDEEREAARALRGTMLRQEVYVDDGTALAAHPYVVTEQNARIETLQRRGANRHAVFANRAAETLTRHYERAPADPRVQHVLTLEIDDFGNVLKNVAINYPRRQPDAQLPLQFDRDRQAATAILYAEKEFTPLIDQPAGRRAPLLHSARDYELTGYTPTGPDGRFQVADFVTQGASGAALIVDRERAHDDGDAAGRARRLLGHKRILFRRDDLSGLLPLGQCGVMALPGESYTLAYTPGLAERLFTRDGTPLVANLAALLGSGGGSGAGYIAGQALKTAGLFPAGDADDSWWMPSGRSYFSPGSGDNALTELAYARAHFYLGVRMRSPFHTAAVPCETIVSYDAHDLLRTGSVDAVGNRLTVGARRADGTPDPARQGNDYRVLQPCCVSDPNRNVSAVLFDALGAVVATARQGKVEDGEGDSLDGVDADLDDAMIAAVAADPAADPLAVLGSASTRLVHDHFAFVRTRGNAHPDPVAVYTMAREIHASEILPGDLQPVQLAVSYADGFGREIQKKMRAEAGALTPGGPVLPERWVTSGWTIFNNKGQPVRQYEPFFAADHQFQFAAITGISPAIFYDPLGRIIARIMPDGSHEKMLITPWQQISWDVNDCVALDPRSDPDTAALVAAYFADPLLSGWQSWLARRQSGALGATEQASAAKALAHAATPSIVHMDALGRPVLTIVDNGDDPANPGTRQLYAARVILDIEGQEREIRDPVVEAGDPLGRVVARYAYDIAGQRVRQESQDAGRRWSLADVGGGALRSWNDRGQLFAIDYDPLRRPLRSWGEGIDPANPQARVLLDRMVYGEQFPGGESANLRGALALHFDSAGLVSNMARDFSGNVTASSRRLAAGQLYRSTLDWSAADAIIPAAAMTVLDPAILEAALAPTLEPTAFAFSARFDALGRLRLQSTPATPAMQPSLIRPRYNAAGLLDGVAVNIRGAQAGGQPVWTDFVSDIEHDAKGQRRRIAYGNGVTTAYEHDPLSFRLTRMVTRRDAALFPADCPQPPLPGWPGCQIQSLRYSYDAAGNMTHVRDEAQQAVYFANRRVEPDADYRYDPLYRLVEARGREHLGQTGAPTPHNHDDAARMRQPQPGDGQAMGRYVERYIYDAIGNMLAMQHSGSDPAHPGWTRHFDYAEASRIENGAGGALMKTGNRLTASRIGSGAAETYSYDRHGNMLALPHLGGGAPNIHWDERDRLHSVDLGGGGRVYYVYDAGGQRVRKIWEKSANLVEERIYLGGVEIFRRQQGAARLERETLHVMDDARRIAMIETRTIDTVGNDPAPQQLIRYQLAGHLGSSSLELDAAAQIISYEEYAPFGATTYQAVRSATETPKRYRFTGKERDEESGLCYHGARYYAPWLARWISADPAGLVDGANLYAYVRCNPVKYNDPTGLQSVPPDLADALDGALDALDADQPFTSQGKGLREVPLTMDIDEPDPVGQKSISPADARKRALDINNRQFLDQATNRQTKWLGVDPRSVPVSGNTVSVANDANALLTRKFGDIAEMQSIFDEAVGKIKDPNKYTPTQLKAKVNANIWDIIKNGQSEDAKKVRKALSTLGFQNIPGKGFVMQAVDNADAALKPAAKAAAVPTAAKAAEKALESAPVVAKATKTTKVVTGLAKTGRHALAAVPLVGIGANLASAGYNWDQGNYITAAADAFGAIPIAGDVLDAARGGYEAGGLATEHPGVEKTAMATGDAVRDAAKWFGASDDTATVIGAGGAALGAIGEVASWGVPGYGQYRFISGLLE